MDMTKEQLHKYILRYGTILKDIQFDVLGYRNPLPIGCHRMRIITINNDLYYDHMCNGGILECHQLSPVNGTNIDKYMRRSDLYGNKR